MLAGFGLSACGYPSDSIAPPQTDILGGRPVKERSGVAQHVVALEAHNSQAGYLCTAVLITEHAALTAGHCGLKMRQGQVVFSTDLSTTDAERREVSEVYVQPQFARTVKHLDHQAEIDPNELRDWGDLALIEFSGELPEGYSPIELLDDSHLSDGQKVVLAGYGLRDPQDPSTAGRLDQVKVAIREAQYSDSEFRVEQTELKGACHGDSGGPALVKVSGKWYIAGITSRGLDEDCASDSLYTKPSFYVDWINQVLKKN
jgi:secreted trypsin-like serine protease